MLLHTFILTSGPLASVQMHLVLRTYLKVAGGLGIEPRFTASKAAVRPLDDPPMIYIVPRMVNFSREPL